MILGLEVLREFTDSKTLCSTIFLIKNNGRLATRMAGKTSLNTMTKAMTKTTTKTTTKATTKATTMIKSILATSCLLFAVPAALAQTECDYDQNGFTVSSDDYKINVGTLLQYDAMHANSDKTKIKGGNDWRDQRLNITGKVGDHLGFKFSYDFRTETYKDIWISDRVRNLTVGQFKSPVGMENQQSARWWTFSEASMATMTAPQRFVGVKWQPVFEDQWMLALSLQQANLNDHSMSHKPVRATGRLVYSPFHNQEETLHLGGSFQWAKLKDEDRKVSIGVPPEVKFEDMPRIGSTGSIKASNHQSGGLEASYARGPLTLSSEYVYNRIKSKDKDQTYKFHGAYAQASYFLDNTTYRVYDLANGTYGPPSNTDMTWELAARASWLDLDDKDIKGGTKTNYTLGVNFYVNLNLKLALNYVKANIKNGPNGDEAPDMLVFRTQLAF